MVDGVLAYSDAHFWQQSSEQIIGTLHVQVAPSSNEQKTIHIISQLLRERGLILVTVQIEKPTFVKTGLKISYIQQHQSVIQPQVYVDCGPHVIRNV